MRLFFALELPSAVIAAMTTLQQQIESRGTSARFGKLTSQSVPTYPIKWVATSARHLTLVFLGEVAETLVPHLLAAKAAQNQQPLQLRLGKVGAFPNLRQPQTLWVGVDGESADLIRRQQTLMQALQPLDLSLETRPFHPHLTLGRVKREITTSQLAALADGLRTLPASPPIAWQSGPLVLFQSTLTRAGPLYTKIEA